MSIRNWHIGQLLTMWVGFLGAFSFSALRLAENHRLREELSRDHFSTYLSPPPRDSAQRADLVADYEDLIARRAALDSAFRSAGLSNSGSRRGTDDLTRQSTRELLEGLRRSERLRSALLVYTDYIGRDELNAYYNSVRAGYDRSEAVLTALTASFALVPLLATWTWFGGRRRPDDNQASPSVT